MWKESNLMINKLKANSIRIGTVKLRIIAIVLTLCVLCTVTAFATASAGSYVEINDTDQKTTVFTMKTEPDEIAEQAGIVLGDCDYLDLSGFIPGEDSAIDVVRASFVGVDDGGEQTVYFDFIGNVADAIDFAKVDINLNDHVNYGLSEPVRDCMIISVARAFPVTVVYHGEARSVELALGTVSDALDAAGVVLGENDVVSISVTEMLVSGMRIFVDEVTYSERTETEEIEFDKVTKKTSELYKGETKVTQEGRDGVLTVTYREKYVNGELDETKAIDREVTEKAIDQITLVGTKKRPASTKSASSSSSYFSAGEAISPLAVPADVSMSNGVPSNYKKVITGRATAYTGGGVTSTGRNCAMGHVAVDPDIIPYGSKLYIVADDGMVYGYCIASDTGGDMRNGRFLVDLYMDSESMCYSWGVRQVSVYVIE